MPRREKVIQEIVRGLEGLMTLNEWEQTLLKDLRGKAQDGLRLGRDLDRREGEQPGRKP